MGRGPCIFAARRKVHCPQRGTGCIGAMRALIPTLTRRAVPKLHSKLLPTLQPRLSVATLVTEKPRLPFEGVRIVEKAGLLSGRLTGLLFADQGAEVLVLDPSEGADVDSYLNRGKIAISESDVALDSADIIIVDGEDDSIARLPHQIMMRTVAALPGELLGGTTRGSPLMALPGKTQWHCPGRPNSIAMGALMAMPGRQIALFGAP